MSEGLWLRLAQQASDHRVRPAFPLPSRTSICYIQLQEESPVGADVSALSRALRCLFHANNLVDTVRTSLCWHTGYFGYLQTK